MEFSSLLLVLLLISNIHSETPERPKAQVSVQLNDDASREETVTLTCDINGGGNTNWQYNWYKESKIVSQQQKYTIRSVSESDEGKYTCIGAESRGSRQSDTSDEVTLTVSDIKPTLTVQPQSSVFTGDTVTLICKMDESTGYEFIFSKPPNPGYYEASGTKTISSVKVSDGGEYKCRARTSKELYYTQYSEPVTVTVKERPKVSVWPDEHVFREETVTLACDINGGGNTNWQYNWYKESKTVSSQQKYTIRSVSESDEGKYTCIGAESRGSRQSDTSDEVTLTVSALPRVTVRVTPDTFVFTGETVTLKCEIEEQYTSLHWRYLWYKHRSGTSVVSSDSNIFSISSASDQNQFWCRGERDGRPSSSQDSDHVTLSVKEKPKAELTSVPEGSVLTGNTVTLMCRMNQSKGFKFYWYKHTQSNEKMTTDTNSYTIYLDSVSDGGQFWCRAGRGNPVYYTDYSDVLWINVTASSSSSQGLKVGVAVGLSVVFLIIFLVLLWCYKNKKGKGVSPHQNISQTSDQKHNEDGDTPLQSGDAHIYDAVDAANNKNTSIDNESGGADLTYADIELKPKKEVRKKKEKKDVASGSNDVTYAQIK